MAKVGLCVTTLNEAGTIGKLLLNNVGLNHIYMVDAGSADVTCHEALLAQERYDLRLWFCHHPDRIPIGEALVEAWRAALAECDVIAQMDAGGSHDPEDFSNLWHALDSDAAAFADRPVVVIGSRFMPGASYEGRHGKRYWLSRLASAMMNAKTGQRLTDWTSGYRLFTRSALSYLVNHHYQATMHGWQIEVVLAALALGFEVREAPITYKPGRSSFSLDVAMEAFGVWRRA